MRNTSANNFNFKQVSVLTICAHCKKVKQNDLSWRSAPFLSLAGKKISHGICPSCVTILYPDISEDILVVLKEGSSREKIL